MSQLTIREVSTRFQISARMLRYYEKMGMLTSTRKPDYAYRAYEESAILRLQQIIILRKLQIPLKKIRIILDGTKEDALQIVREQLQAMEGYTASLQTKKQILEKLALLLEKDTPLPEPAQQQSLLLTPAILSLADLLPLEKHQLKEEQLMSTQKEQKDLVEKDSCVRLVQLPPYTVAAYQFEGDEPEEQASKVMNEFICSSRLYEHKPDARLFGFNNPDPRPDDGAHGYEYWVTIPEAMEVPAPLVKKQFSGGLYAAYPISFPDFHEWKFLTEWVARNEQYQENYQDTGMGGCLEEHLNWVYAIHTGQTENGITGKLDLLLPIQPRS